MGKLLAVGLAVVAVNVATAESVYWLNAEEFQRKGGGGDFTLLTSGSDMFGTPSVEVRGKGVTYELGARTLTCHVPRIGLMILLK